MVIWNEDWKKAQCDRLEADRKKEQARRLTWWACERAAWEDNQERKEEEGWKWGSWQWSQRNWPQDEWWGSTGARGSSDPPPPEPTAEPTASSTPLAIMDYAYPTRNHGEDVMALRVATITPVTFMPQRHVTMALGRPVIVLSGF